MILQWTVREEGMLGMHDRRTRGAGDRPVTAVRDGREMAVLLKRIDGRGYKAYKELEGPWAFSDHTLHFDHVQGDPFADPSRVRVVIEPSVASLPAASYRSTARAWGAAGHLVRVLERAAARSSRRYGTGKGGLIRVEPQGQVVLPQTALRVSDEGEIEVRFQVGLPAHGRRISGRDAITLLTDTVPLLVRTTLIEGRDDEALLVAATTNEDAEWLRDALAEEGLVAFVADGSVLPRRSGVDERPLASSGVVPIVAPPSLRVTLTAPNAGAVPGMGVPEGVTLIVGGGFHGKSTLLRAIQEGVYNHAPGDGRERVVTREDAVKIRAEDGRSVVGVDISGFIDGLPGDWSTVGFTTENASGSTSQAAAIVEAIEAGSATLLIDEDTSATNFMIRDRRMQELVPGPEEPITPFVDRVRELHAARGVSTVMVIGGSGDYLDVADTVIRMNGYHPSDVTTEAKAVAARLPTGRAPEGGGSFHVPPPRRVDASSIDAGKGRRSSYVRVPDDRTLHFGSSTIDLVAVEQISLRAQTRAIGLALELLGRVILGDHDVLPEALDVLEATLAERGLDALGTRRAGDLAACRRFEVAAALNRLRAVRVTPQT